MGDAVDIVFCAEDLDTVSVTVGNDAELNVTFAHLAQPCGHFLRGNIRGIRDDGIIKIHHQQPEDNDI